MNNSVLFEAMISFIKETNENIDTLDWNCISSYRYLSEDFITKFKDNVNWSIICTFQKLTEDFIRTHSDKIDFKALSNTHSQTMTLDFIHEYKNLLNMKVISKNKKIHKNKYLSRVFKECGVSFDVYSSKDEFEIFLIHKFSRPTPVTETQDTEFYDSKYKCCFCKNLKNLKYSFRKF